MGNCLVTRLKGVVENNDLPVLGAAMFEVVKKDNPQYSDYALRIYAEEANQSIITSTGGEFQIVGGTHNLTEYPVIALADKWGDNAVYPEGDSWTKIRYTVSDIYNIKSLEMGSQVFFVNGVSSLLDYSVIEILTLRGGKADIGSCMCGTLKEIDAEAGATVAGNWYDIIANNPNLKLLYIWDGINEIPGNMVGSSLETIAGFSGDLAQIPVTIKTLKSDYMTGSLNDLVTRIRATRTSGNMTLILANNSQMTLDGVSIPTWCSNHSIIPASYMYLVWTDDSITLTTTNPNA